VVSSFVFSNCSTDSSPLLLHRLPAAPPPPLQRASSKPLEKQRPREDGAPDPHASSYPRFLCLSVGSHPPYSRRRQGLGGFRP
jgi:hypothetical protein